MAKKGKPSLDSQVSEVGTRRAQLNITITEDELWAFREWCVRHRIKQQDAFRRAFELLKSEIGS